MPIHSENIFHFPAGIPAFENVKQFLFVMRPATQPFVFMQALEPADLSFVCIDPFLVYPGYNPRISEADASFLHVEKPEDFILFSIVTVHKDARNTTCNLQAPIAINLQACVGKQVICENQNFPIRHRIWDALSRQDDAEPNVVLEGAVAAAL
jgi:flagellar assembly factor FliW